MSVFSRISSQSVLYAACGFVLGFVGASVYTKTPLLPPGTAEVNEHPLFAQACMYDTTEQDAEIFFLSCGGIF